MQTGVVLSEQKQMVQKVDKSIQEFYMAKSKISYHLYWLPKQISVSLWYDQ